MRTSDSKRRDSTLRVDVDDPTPPTLSSLSSLPKGREGKERKRVVKVSFEVAEDVAAWLSTKKRRGEKTELFDRVLRAAMALEGKPENHVRALLERKRQAREALDAEIALLETKLSDFDEDLNREAAWRDDIALYLGNVGTPSEAAERNWCEARQIPAETYHRLKREVQRRG